jgi:DNA ligase-1
MSNAYNHLCEGLVIKAAHPNLTYYDITGKRTGQWVKLKNRGLVGANMRDSLDLIPIGAYYGKGKRKGLYGSFLMAAYSS